jgi:hypothetical protein
MENTIELFGITFKRNEIKDGMVVRARNLQMYSYQLIKEQIEAKKQEISLDKQRDALMTFVSYLNGVRTG